MFDPEEEATAAICKPSVYEKTSDVEIATDITSFELGRMLELHNYLLQYVFKYLKTKDLHTASLISPKWAEAAKWELEKRTTATWISYFLSDFSTCNVQKSSNYEYSNPAMCIVVYSPPKLKDIYLHYFKNDIMLFTEYLEKEEEKRKDTLNEIEYFTIYSPHLFPSNIKTKNVEVLYQGIGIPFIRNIRTTIFNWNSKKMDSLSDVIKDNERIKCLLLFNTITEKNFIHLLRALLKGQNSKNVAVGGGLIIDFIPTYIKDISCILFLEEEGVDADFNAYSIVINYEGHEGVNVDHFETEILKLKETSILRKNGVIFRFGHSSFFYIERWSDKKEETVTLIEKHFPNYPLLAMRGNRQIGWNSVNVHGEKEFDITTEAASKCKKLKADIPKCEHIRSTVVVLLTWGKKL